MRARRSAAALTVALVALSGCTGGPAPGPTPVVSHSFGPGADGIGDEYFPKAGNGGYDVANYDLDVTFDTKNQELTAAATITAKATADLSRFNLDLKGLTVDSVTVNGDPATNQRTDNELTIIPAKGIEKDTTFVTAVHYSGQPQPYVDDQLGKEGFQITSDGAFAAGEPEVAASWYPVNDHPRDKATYTTKITVADNLTAISNGVLKSKASSGGRTTWTWVEDAPMASYLATMVVGNFRVQEGTHGGKPVFIAVDEVLSNQIDAVLGRTGEIIDFLATYFGPYPFDAMGGIVINQQIGFALENQTRPIYSPKFFAPGRDGVPVVVHELAHQWFGDSVSINEWREIWLNEGFATYAEWLWSEAKGGESAQQWFDGYYRQADSPLWRVAPGEPGRDALFAGSVYQRGAMTLQALRVSVGDDAFFKILKAWASQKANQNATTEEFVALAEQISGKSLKSLFQAWLFGRDRPARP
jgi:aminopeptidase N